MPIDAQSLNNTPQSTNTSAPEEKKPGVSIESLNEASGGVSFAPTIQVNPRDYNRNIASGIHTIDFHDHYKYYGKADDQGFISDPLSKNYRPTWDEGDWARNQPSSDYWSKSVNRMFSGFQDSFFGGFSNTADNISSTFTGNFGDLLKPSDDAQSIGRGMSASAARDPIYRTDAMMAEDDESKGFFGAVGKYTPGGAGSGRRWAELVASSGFTLGTLANVAVEEAALGVATYFMPVLAPITGARTARNLARVSKVFGGSAKAYQTMRKAAKARQMARAASGVPAAAFYTARMANQATFEAGMEAGMTKLSMEQTAFDEIRDEYGRLPTAEEYANIEEKSNNAADFVYGWNMPLLTVSNLIMIPNIIKPAKPFRIAKSGYLNRIVNRNGKYLTRHDAVKKSLQNKLGNRAGSVLFGTGRYGSIAARNIATEGTEELAQGIGAGAAENYYNPLHTEYGKSNQEMIRALGDSLRDSMQTGKGWDEFVAGGLMGLGFGGAGSVLQSARRARSGEQTELESSRETANNMNKAVTDFMEQVIHSPNNVNLDHQTQIAAEMREAEGRGDTKRLKDLESAAKANLFNVMSRTSKDKTFVNDMFELVDIMEEETPGTKENLLGGQSLEEFKENLMSEYKAYDSDLSMFVDSLKLDKLDGADRQAAYAAAHTLAANNQYMRDGFTRVENLRTDMTEMLSQTKEGKNANTSFQLEKLFDSLIDPTQMADTISAVETSIETNEALLKDSQLPTAEKQQKRRELEQQKSYLGTLNKISNKIYNKDGSISAEYGGDQFTQEIVNEVAKFAPGVVSEGFANSMKDMMQINSDYEHLVFQSNMMRNPDFRQKYIEGFISEAEKSRAQDSLDRVQRANRFNDVDTRVADSETITQEQFDREMSKADLASNTINSVIGQLTSLQPRVADGKYEYGGEVYDTADEAYDAILKNEGPEVQQYAATFKKRANGIKLGETDPAKMAEAQEREAIYKERIKTVEEQQKLNKLKGKENDLSVKDANKMVADNRKKIASNEKKIEAKKKREQTPKIKQEIKDLQAENERLAENVKTIEDALPEIELLEKRVLDVSFSTGAVEILNNIFNFEQDVKENKIFPSADLKQSMELKKDELAKQGYEMTAPQIKSDFTAEMEANSDATIQETADLPEGITIVAKVNKPAITRTAQGGSTQTLQRPDIIVSKGTGTNARLEGLNQQLENIDKTLEEEGVTPEGLGQRANKQKEIDSTKAEIKDEYNYEEALPATIEEAEKVKELSKTEKEAIEEGELPPSAEDKINEKVSRGVPLNQNERKGLEIRNQNRLERERSKGPKTQNQVDNQPVTPLARFTAGALTLNFNLAFSSLYAFDNLSNFLQRSTSPNVNRLLTKMRASNDGISVMTVSLNDTVLPAQDVVDLSGDNFNPDTVAADLLDVMNNDATSDRAGLVAFKDEKNRLFIVANTQQAFPNASGALNLQDAVEAKYDLYRIPRLRILRKGNRVSGEIVGSSFNTGEFGTAARKEVAKVNVFDEVQVVLPSNTFNQGILNALNEGSITAEQAANNVRVDIVSNGQVIGVMRAGDYQTIGTDNQLGVKRSKALRDQLNLTENIKKLKRKSITLGSVKISGKTVHRNLGLDIDVTTDLSTSFLNLSKYEEGLTGKNDGRFSVDYFVAEEVDLAKNKEGGTLTLAQANRQMSGFRKGGLYMRIEDTDTGEVLTVQAVIPEAQGPTADGAYDMSLEDLKNDAFKTKYLTNLNYRGENPILSTQVFVDHTSFSPNTTQTNHTEEVTDGFNESEDGGAVNVETKDNQEVPLTNAKRDSDKGTVTGTDPNNLEVTYSDSDVVEVKEYDDSNQPQKADNAPNTEASEEAADIIKALNSVLGIAKSKLRNPAKIILVQGAFRLNALAENGLVLDTQQQALLDAANAAVEANGLEEQIQYPVGTVLSGQANQRDTVVRTNKLPAGMSVIQEVIRPTVINKKTGNVLIGGGAIYVVALGTNEAVEELDKATSQKNTAYQQSLQVQKQIKQAQQKKDPAAEEDNRVAAINKNRQAELNKADKPNLDAKNRIAKKVKGDFDSAASKVTESNAVDLLSEVYKLRVNGGLTVEDAKVLDGIEKAAKKVGYELGENYLGQESKLGAKTNFVIDETTQGELGDIGQNVQVVSKVNTPEILKDGEVEQRADVIAFIGNKGEVKKVADSVTGGLIANKKEAINKKYDEQISKKQSVENKPNTTRISAVTLDIQKVEDVLREKRNNLKSAENAELLAMDEEALEKAQEAQELLKAEIKFQEGRLKKLQNTFEKLNKEQEQQAAPKDDANLTKLMERQAELQTQKDNADAKIEELQSKYAADYIASLEQQEQDKSRPRPKPNQEPVVNSSEINDKIDSKMATLQAEKEALIAESTELLTQWKDKTSEANLEDNRVELAALAKEIMANREAIAANNQGLTLEEQQEDIEVSNTEELDQLKEDEKSTAEEIAELEKELKASKKAEKSKDKLDPAGTQTKIDNLEKLDRELLRIQTITPVSSMREALREIEPQLKDYMTPGQKVDKAKGRNETFATTKRGAISGKNGLRAKLAREQRALQESLDVRPSSEVQADLEKTKELQDKNLAKQQELQPGVENLNSTPISNEEIADINEMLKEEQAAEEVNALKDRINYNPVLDSTQSDPYAVFNIPQSADQAEVTARYVRLANDVIKQFGETEAGFLGLQNLYNAYEKLMEERNATDKMADPVRQASRRGTQGKQLEIQFNETPTEEKQEFIVGNGQEGDTFTMPDGNEVTVTSRDDDAGTMTVEKGNETVTISTEDGSRAEAREEVDYQDLRENPPTLAELASISEKVANGVPLSPMEVAMKNMYSEKFTGVNKFRVNYRNPQDFGLRGAQITLASIGIDLNSDLSELVSTYLDRTEQGENIPGNLTELMREAGFDQSKIEAYQDALTYTTFANIWAYSSQADIITGRENTSRLREIALNNAGPMVNEISRLQRLDFNNMSSALIKQSLGVTRRKIEDFFGEQSLYLAGTDVVQSLSKEEAIGTMEAIVEFITDMNNKPAAKQLLPNYINLKNNLTELGMDLNLSTVAFTSMPFEMRGIGQRLVSEDSADFLLEYDDVAMSDRARAAETLAVDTLLVKSDKGNMQEVDLSSITEQMRNSQEVQQDVKFINETLKNLGKDDYISDLYVAAYHKVNGNATEMIARMTDTASPVNQILRYRELGAQYQNETIKDFFNKEKQEENVEDKTCK